MREAEFDELFRLRAGPMPPAAEFEAELLLRLEEEMTRLGSAYGVPTSLDELSTVADTAVSPLGEDESMPTTFRNLLLVAAAVILVIGLVFALGSREDNSAPVFTDEPEQSENTSVATTLVNDQEAEAALNAYADGINARSVDDVMAAFAEDSRMIGHPQNRGELKGKAAITAALRTTVTFARRDPDPYSISDVVVDGDTVSWSYVWINDEGEEFCAVGNEIDVDDGGLIEELRWGDDPGECNE